MRNEYGSNSEKYPLYFKNKHSFEDYIGFEVPEVLIDQFTDWCYADAMTRRNRSVASTALQNRINPESDLGGMKITEKDWFYTLIHTERPWNDERKSTYVDKSMTDPLEYVIVKDAPQQGPQSNDCGMFVCTFAEFVSHGVFEISSRIFRASNHRLIYGSLLWDYARRKQNDGAISESEVTVNVTSRLDGLKGSREVVSKFQILQRAGQKERKM